jgi:hypothetical protein
MDELDDASGSNLPGSLYRKCFGFSRTTVGGASQFEQVWLSSGSDHILNATFGVLCAPQSCRPAAFMLGGEVKRAGLSS